MEDPWGSPWTNDSPPKIDLPAPPPHAHFSVDHNSQRASPALTPWNDDDDAWGGWAEAGKDSSPRWGRSPGLRPIGGSPAGSRLSSPAPEAWGNLMTLETARVRDERNGDSAISLGEGLRPIEARAVTRTPSPARDLKESVADIWRQPDPALSIRSVSPLPSEDDGRPGSPDGPPGPALRRGKRPEPLRQPSNKVQGLVEMYDDMAKRSHSVSPIDPSMRKVSGNESLVPDMTPEAEDQERLESKLETELELEPETKIEPELSPTLVEEPEKEEVEEKTEEVPDQDQAQAESDSWSDFESPTQDEEVLEEPETQVAQEEAPITEAKVPDEAPREPLQPRPKRPSIPFAIDMSKLDDLFPSVETSFPTPEPVPDVIIDDTFSSISERTAWYRMSRFGSIRKHNMGDDENYVRIGWANSEVRGKAIRIVRRWMEEDSITGRVVLGRRGGAAGARIFNWDSSAPQVEISELLAARKSHSRQMSTNSKGTTASPTATAFGWSSNPPASPTAAIPPPAADRSPITEPTSAAESSPAEDVKTSPVAAKKPSSPTTTKPPTIATPPSPIRPTPIKPTTRPISISQPIPSPTSPSGAQPPSPIKPTPLLSTTRPVSISQTITSPTSPLAQPPTNAGWGDEEDDDDWGDMVSSPTAGETNGGFSSMDAIVDANTGDKKGHAAKPSITTFPPEDDFIESKLAQETMTNGRSPLDVPSPGGLMPGHSRSTTVDWSFPRVQGFVPSHSRSTTVDMGASPVQGLISHSRSTTVDLNTPRSPLDALASSNLMSNKAKSPIENTNKANGWGAWSMDLVDGAGGLAAPRRDSNIPSKLPSKPVEFTKATSPTESQPMSLPVSPEEPPSYDTSKDDEIVANILRDLPDLSYMLR